MKVKVCILLVVVIAMFCACSKDNDDNNNNNNTGGTGTNTGDNTGNNTNNTGTTTGTDTADVVTGPSYAYDKDSLLYAISEEGSWIIYITEDFTIDQDLVVAGEFLKKDTNEPYRKFALYAQDENRNITARYTLTAPKLTVRSENTRIQGGTFKGDVYVEANGFHLVSGTVDGNIYFATEEYQKSFTQDEESKVTGKMEVQK